MLPIAMLLEEGESAGALKDVPKAAPKKEEPKKAEAASNGKAQPEKAVPMPQKQVTSGDRVFASPLARRMAEQMGVDLSTLKGSGPHGRRL